MVSKKLLLLFIIFISINFISASSGCLEDQIDINTASLEDLDKIIWVGSVTAQGIVDTRPFNSVDDLIKVYGIGEIKLQDIKEQNLACVEDEEKEIIGEKEETPEEEPEPEVIKIIINQTPEEKNTIKQEIQLNPKVINTEKSTSKLIKNKYALIALAFFSMLIIFLLVLKLNPRDKNEFD